MTRMAALWLVLAFVAGTLLFKTSQQVNDGRQRLAVITNDIRREEDSLRVLQAEWSYLNQPDRLEKLSKQYLKLVPMKGQQFAGIDSLPLRPAPEEAPAADEAPVLAAYGAETISVPPEETAALPDETKTVSAATSAAVPLRKPASLKSPAAAVIAAPVAVKPTAALNKASVPAKVAAPAAPAQAQNSRSFGDVLNSLGGGL